MQPSVQYITDVLQKLAIMHAENASRIIYSRYLYFLVSPLPPSPVSFPQLNFVCVCMYYIGQ